MAVPRRRTGIAAVIAGASFFAGQAGELVFGSPSNLVGVIFVLFVAVGLIGLAVALWDLRSLIVKPRSARVGLRLALAGAAILMLFAVQVIVEQARTGQIPDNFALFALGFLLVLIGQALFGPGLRGTVLLHAWPLPLLATLGLVVALAVTIDPIHDIGLFVFEGAWIAFGVLLLRSRRGHTVTDQGATV
jgi:hypothetical protein